MLARDNRKRPAAQGLTRREKVDVALASGPIHPLAADYRLLKDDELSELVDDIQRRGLIHPIVRHKGVLLDGRNRLVACHLAGVEPKFTEYDGKEEDIPRYIVSVNDHRRHETREEKQANIKRMLKLDPTQSNNAIAKKLGYSDKTIDTARKKMEATSEIPKLAERTGKDGKARKRPKPRTVPAAKPVYLEDEMPPIEAQPITPSIKEEPQSKPAAPRSHSRSARWGEAASRALDALRELAEIQSEYEGWRDNLPENLCSSPVSEKLDAVCDLDIAGTIETIEEAEAIDLPLGFGRD
jgi:hypothetical protein